MPFYLVERDDDGNVVEISELDPATVTVVEGPDGEPAGYLVESEKD